jgi:hypothetical protein
MHPRDSRLGWNAVAYAAKLLITLACLGAAIAGCYDGAADPTEPAESPSAGVHTNDLRLERSLAIGDAGVGRVTDLVLREDHGRKVLWVAGAEGVSRFIDGTLLDRSRITIPDSTALPGVMFIEASDFPGSLLIYPRRGMGGLSVWKSGAGILWTREGQQRRPQYYSGPSGQIDSIVSQPNGLVCISSDGMTKWAYKPEATLVGFHVFSDKTSLASQILAASSNGIVMLDSNGQVLRRLEYGVDGYVSGISVIEAFGRGETPVAVLDHQEGVTVLDLLHGTRESYSSIEVSEFKAYEFSSSADEESAPHLLLVGLLFDQGGQMFGLRGVSSRIAVLSRANGIVYDEILNDPITATAIDSSAGSSDLYFATGSQVWTLGRSAAP